MVKHIIRSWDTSILSKSNDFEYIQARKSKRIHLTIARLRTAWQHAEMSASMIFDSTKAYLQQIHAKFVPNIEHDEDVKLHS